MLLPRAHRACRSDVTLVPWAAWVLPCGVHGAATHPMVLPSVASAIPELLGGARAWVRRVSWGRPSALESVPQRCPMWMGSAASLKGQFQGLTC